jgi:hypothetical protein
MLGFGILLGMSREKIPPKLKPPAPTFQRNDLVRVSETLPKDGSFSQRRGQLARIAYSQERFGSHEVYALCFADGQMSCWYSIEVLEAVDEALL